eukprot:10396653-Lingulodinium_polyedra.AAC.1
MVGLVHARDRLPEAEQGWHWTWDAVLETELGDPYCRRLGWGVYEPKGRGHRTLEELGLRQRVAPPAGPLLGPRPPAGSSSWATAELVRLEPALRARCGPLYPQA